MTDNRTRILRALSRFDGWTSTTDLAIATKLRGCQISSCLPLCIRDGWVERLEEKNRYPRYRLTPMGARRIKEAA